MGTRSVAGSPAVSTIRRIVGGAVLLTIATRVVIGNFVVNEWEGWGTFAAVAITTVIEVLVLGLLVYLAARSFAARGHPTIGAILFGFLAVLSLAVPYSAQQAVLGAGAVSLALVSRDRSDNWHRLPLVGGVLGVVAVLCWAAFMGATVVTGDWPVNY